MRCEQAGRMMSARLDGYLDDRGASRLQDHLASCSACRKEWQRMQALDKLFRSAPMREAPSGLHVSVTSRIERRKQVQRAVIGGLVLSAGTATLALLVFVPFALGLWSNAGIAPTLLTGGLDTFTQLLTLFDALSRTLFVLLDQFTVPLTVLGAGGLLVTMMLNGLWIALVRKLTVARWQKTTMNAEGTGMNGRNQYG